MLSQVDLRNRVLDGGTDLPCEGTISRGNGMPWHARRYSDVNCAKTAEPIEMSFGLWTHGGARKHVLEGPRSPCEGAIIIWKDMPGNAQWHSLMSCAKMAEPIDLPFGLWTLVGRRKHKLIIFARLLQCAVMGGHIGATWQIYNWTVCGGDAALCQIILTTCLVLLRKHL